MGLVEGVVLGLLHVRPVLDLHSASDLKKYRQVANETSALVRQFKGSLSAEHGVGIARTEYMREQLGDELLEVMRAIKHAFDPKNIFNPGKIFADGQHKIDNHLVDAKLGALNAMTIHCEKSALTFFMHGNICLTALHAGGELTSETRAELARITQELSRTYSQPEPSFHVDH